MQLSPPAAKSCCCLLTSIAEYASLAQRTHLSLFLSSVLPPPSAATIHSLHALVLLSQSLAKLFIKMTKNPKGALQFPSYYRAPNVGLSKASSNTFMCRQDGGGVSGWSSFMSLLTSHGIRSQGPSLFSLYVSLLIQKCLCL